MRRLLATAAIVLGAIGPAAADDGAGAIAPVAPRVLTAPTAWLQPHGRVLGTAGVSHRGGVLTALSAGLGDLAEVDLELSDRIGACDPCEPGAARPRVDATSALFKLGLGRAPRGERPGGGVALGLRRSIASRRLTVGERTGAVEAAELFLVTGGAWRGVELHVGAALHDAAQGGAGLGGLARRVRPLAGLAWTPRPYPRTTVLADLAWAPVVEPGGPVLRWALGWGVRYQALAWGSIELAVRNREAEPIEAATVLVRVNGSFAVGR